MSVAQSVVLIALALALGTFRVIGEVSPAYQAAAHMFVAYLAVTWFYTRRPRDLTMAILLCIVEILCFIASFFR